MKEQTFVALNTRQWEDFDALLKSVEDNKQADTDFSRLPELYRQICADLARAKQRGYSRKTIEQLNSLALSGYQQIQGAREERDSRWLWFIRDGFAQSLRMNMGYIWVASLLFFGPLFVTGGLIYSDSELVYGLVSQQQVSQYEAMYDPENDRLGRLRDAGTDIYMFGFYIRNNIGVGFRSFAGGLLFGIGSIFFLVYNGIAIGGVAGYLTQRGFQETFYGFVAGHSSFELLAIVFCGAAGLKLGYALVAPGQLFRTAALKKAASEAAPMVYGATLMLVVAAFIEAFWSSITLLPALLKYTVGIAGWLAVIAYVLFAGRDSSSGGAS